MRFVSPETTRIDLKNNEWIEVKTELTVGEDKRRRTAGMRRMAPATAKERGEIDVDWTAMSLGRVEAYLVEWSARDAKGKPVPVSRDAIEALDAESFDEIDEAIQAHIAATEEKKLTKKLSSSAATSTPA